VQRIADTFNAAGLQTIISTNIMGTIWDKLLINVATGALTAITKLTYGELYKQPLLEACGLAAVTEAMAVAGDIRVATYPCPPICLKKERV
jgi:2-dehydropantoate 2-reductase